MELAELELENARLRQQAASEAVKLIGEIVGITSDIFGSEVLVSRSCDPEFPQESYVVFSVQASGSPQSLLSAERNWIKRVEAVAPYWESLRLAIRPA